MIAQVTRRRFTETIKRISFWWIQKIDAFWLWLFKKGRDHLPEYYIDKAFEHYLTERIEALVGSHGESFVIWLLSDAQSLDDGQGRDFRMAGREVRDGRGR